MSGRHRRGGRGVWVGFVKALVEVVRDGLPDDESSEPAPVGSGPTWPAAK